MYHNLKTWTIGIGATLMAVAFVGLMIYYRIHM